MRRKIILYELNEVPWEIVDLHVARRPASAFARLLGVGQSYTTINRDTLLLQPWRTWPTLHCSQLSEDHNCLHLGQDPSTFSGTPIWDSADAAGLSVGLFGPLQSWPARRFASGGFHVPDTFALDARTEPPELEAFQAFNLAMTQENGFSSDVKISRTAALRGGLTLLRHGLTARSIATICRHLIAERRDNRVKAGRAMMQVLPSFDLYWRLHRNRRPDLSIFFTNHVAAMQHRFWGDFVPGYAEQFSYEPDPVFAAMIPRAMDLVDRQLKILLDYALEHPDTRVVIAASMGQGPVQQKNQQPLRVLDRPTSLMRALGIPDAEDGLAMFPMLSVELPDVRAAEIAREAIGTVVDRRGKPVFTGIKAYGRSVVFRMALDPDLDESDDAVFLGSPEGRRLPLSELGMTIRRRLGGGNTGYHTRHGMLLTYQVGDVARHERAEIDILDVAPSLLRNSLDVPVPASMSGRVIPGLFTHSGAHAAPDEVSDVEERTVN